MQRGRTKAERLSIRLRIRSLSEPKYVLACHGLVDMNVAYTILPRAWKERLGNLPTVRYIDCETATQQVVKGEVCGPVEIRLEGFEPVSGEVLFLDMEPEDGVYEPLVGYIVLEQAQAAVDALGHRLVHVERSDLKRGGRNGSRPYLSGVEACS